MKPRKLPRNYQLDQGVVTMIDQIAEVENLSKNAVVSEAVKRYFKRWVRKQSSSKGAANHEQE